MDIVFENPGLNHIGENIFKNLDFHTQLTCRLVRKSLNDLFEKEASKIDLENLLKKFLHEAMPGLRVREIGIEPDFVVDYEEFLKEAQTKLPTFAMNFYLQNILLKESNVSIFNRAIPWIAFAIIGDSKMVELILNIKPIPTCSEWSYAHCLE